MFSTKNLSAASALALALSAGTVAAQIKVKNSDREAIIAAVNVIASGADSHDWRKVRDQFADEVEVDYTSLMGGTPSVMPADELIKNWSNFLPKFTKTKHTINGYQIHIDGDAATSRSRFVAFHQLVGAPGGDTWIVSGHYEHHLRRSADGWKVTFMKMVWDKQEGNTQLPALASR